MSDEPLAFESIDIRRAPGFATDGFEVDDLSPGINIIHGPNGTGKSTLARTMHALLWPGTAHDRSSLLGHFSLADDEWRVDLVGGRPEYQCNGAEANGPALPSSEQHSAYQLALHDLLQHETQDQSFADRIHQESIGGYDLDAAADTLDYDSSPSTAGINEHTQAQNAREALREARKELERLKSEEARLPQLRSQRADAADAQQLVDLYEHAIEYREAQNELESAEARLAEFPDSVAALDGSEATRVEDINEALRKCREQIEAADADRRAAESDLEAADLPPDGLPDGFIANLTERHDTYRNLIERKQRLSHELEEAEERRTKIENELPIETAATELSAFDPGIWDDVAAFLSDAQAVHAERRAYDAYEDILTPEDLDTSQDVETLQRGKQALEQWLATAEPTTTRPQTQVARRIGVLSSILLAGATILLGVLVNPLFFGGLLLAAGILWYSYRQESTSSASADHRATHRETYENLPLGAPSSWSAEDVRAQLNTLYSQLATAYLRAQCEERRAALRPDLAELEAAEADLADERQALLDSYDVAPSTADVELVALTRGLLRWQDADADVQGRQAELDDLTSTIERERDALATKLADYGYDTVPDPATAKQHLRDLEERHATHTTARDQIADAEDTIETAEAEIESLEEERTSIYDTAELEVGDLDELRRLCDQVDDYETAATTVQRKEEVRNNELEALEAHPEYSADVVEYSLGDLQDKQAEYRDTAADYDDLQTTITEIETRIEDAKHDYDLEAATAERDRALDALEERLQEDAASMVGDRLVAHLTDVTEESTRPPVFERSRELLARITHGRYRLELSDAEFRAQDTVKERGFALDELSSGTKLQVLLAVRIAFVEHQEQGCKLPLLLDETLANSDDQRAEIIIDAILELARDGRQIFYFTAQGDEVAKWQAALEPHADIDHATIDITDGRDQDTAIDIPDYDQYLPDTGILPDPAAHDHQSYGDALDVPEFSPQQGAGGAHVWYVVPDPAVLDHLLRMGVETWGQLETLLEMNLATAIAPDDADLAAIRRNGEALNEYVTAWRIGRGNPVTRTALESTDAVTSKFIDDVAELADRVNGDANEILRELEAGAVKRFHKSKRKDLEDYFEEEGYIEQRDTLDASTIRVRMVKRLMEHGLDREDALYQSRDLLQRLSDRAEDGVIF